MGDDRAMRYIDTIDGEQAIVWRASSLGTCDRAIVATARQLPAAPKPEWFQIVLDEGTAMESKINALHEKQTGEMTLADQHEIELLVGEIDDMPVYVRGHIDGGVLLRSPDDVEITVLREYKKARASTYDKFVKAGLSHNANYPWQVSAYMHGIGADRCEFVIGKMVEDEWGTPSIAEVTCIEVDEPPYTLKEIRKRVMRVERMIAAGFDAPEVDCDKSTYPCPFYKFHDPEDDAYVLAFGDDRDTEVDKLISEYAVADAEIKKLKQAMNPWLDIKNRSADALRSAIADAGDDADKAKKLTIAGTEITRVRAHYKEQVRPAYDTDYFKIKE